MFGPMQHVCWLLLKLCLLNVAQLLLNICPRSLLTMKMWNELGANDCWQTEPETSFVTQCQVFPDVIMSRTSAMRLGCQEKVKPGVFTHKLLFSLHQSRYYRLVWQFCQCQPIRGHLNSFWPIRSLHLCTTHIKQTRLLAAPSQPTSNVFGA